MQKHIPQRRVAGEVERRIQAGIHAIPRHAAGERRCNRRIRVEDLPYGCKARIEPMNLRKIALPELPADIRKRIDAKPISARLLDPPDAVLRQILRDSSVLLIQIRQNIREPALRHIATASPWSVRI